VEDLLERMAMMKAAYDPERVAASKRAMNELYAKDPNRWLVYRPRWDEAEKECEYVVLAEFATHGEAVRWGMALPDDERSRVTVMSTRLPEPGVYHI
jgi:hypothetical protein